MLGPYFQEQVATPAVHVCSELTPRLLCTQPEKRWWEANLTAQKQGTDMQKGSPEPCASGLLVVIATWCQQHQAQLFKELALGLSPGLGLFWAASHGYPSFLATLISDLVS